MKKPERTHQYIGSCPDCGNVLMIASAIKGDEAWTAQYVAEAIARGLVVTSIDIDTYREMEPKPFPEGHKCEKPKMVRPCCINCGDPILENAYDISMGSVAIAGNFMQIQFHQDCYEQLKDRGDEGAMALDWEWGSGERADRGAAEKDMAILKREKEVANGQVELPFATAVSEAP